MKKNCKRRSVDHKLVELPNLGLFKGSVEAKDVVIGVGLGAAGSGALKYALNATGMSAKLPDLVNRFFPLVGGVVAGGAMHAIFKRKSAAKAKAYFVGAVAGGVAVTAWGALQNQFPQLADLVSVRLNGYSRGMGVLVNDQPGRLAAMNGVIIDDSSSNLAQLNALNMAADDDD